MPLNYTIGIDVGGSSLKCGLVEPSGKIIHSFLKPLEGADTEQAVINLITLSIQQCKIVANESVIGVGIGFPGLVDNNVIIGGADNLPGFENLPLGNILKQRTGFNIVIDNDANMMGLGELTFGSCKGCSDIVFLTIGTGIGGAVVIDGKLYGGYKNRGTELGHTILEYNGQPCSCGSRGCFETYASVNALINNYKNISKNEGPMVNGRYILDQYKQGNANAILAMHQHFDYMAVGISGLINIFSPQKVVIGGGISESGIFYIDEIETRVKSMAMPSTITHTTLVPATLGNQAGILGCAAKAFESCQ